MVGQFGHIKNKKVVKINQKIYRLVQLEKNLRDKTINNFWKAFQLVGKIYDDIVFNQEQSRKFAFLLMKLWRYEEREIIDEINKWRGGLMITIVYEHTQFRIELYRYQGNYKVRSDRYSEQQEDHVREAFLGINWHETRNFGGALFEQIGRGADVIHEIVEDAKVIQRLLNRLDKVPLSKLKKMSQKRVSYLFQDSLKISFET